jgi:threonine dehydrogenase-like Zn-dependent dehydrogenase
LVFYAGFLWACRRFKALYPCFKALYHVSPRGGGQYPTAMSLLASGKIDVKPFITHHFTLDQINEAIETGLTDPTAIKIIVHPAQ